MPVIKISAFAGERPLIISRLLPETASKSAFNVRMDDGGLTPINKSVPDGGGGIAVENARTIFKHNDNWFSWPGIVHAVPGPVADDRLYYTGDGAPKLRVAGVIYPLALAGPTDRPVATVGGTGTGDTVSRTYAWTYVTDFGEESAPSPASIIVDWKPGQTLTLSGMTTPPAGRNITKQRIYRSQTGSSGTYLYFIAERAVSAGNFIDTVAVDSFAEPLPSTGWTPPPAGLSGLTAMPNGMMAAFVGRDVYFSEPWRPHAWPESYVMACDSNVVGLASIGTSLVVMTEGQPYLLSGSTPDTMQSVKLEASFPCINARGIADVGHAICYPTNDGLAVVRADGSIGLATEGLFNRDTWQALSPETALGTQHGGVYVMFYDTADPEGNQSFGVISININATPFLVRSSEYAAAVFFNVADSGLYFVRPGDTKIYRYDAPKAPPESYSWVSKEFWLTQPVNFGAILIDAGFTPEASTAEEFAAAVAQNNFIIANDALDACLNEHEFNDLILGGDRLVDIPSYGQLTVGVYADGKLVRSIDKSGRIERLPAKQKCRKWEILVSGNIRVEQIIMAGTIDELRGAM